MLSVQGLSTEYADGKGKVVKAAQDVSFEVPQGKLFTLLGPSGCGKTTTLRSIAGLERPVKGAITVDGCSSGRRRVAHHKTTSGARRSWSRASLRLAPPS